MSTNTRVRLQLTFGFLVVVSFIIWLGFYSETRADTTKANLKIHFLNVGQGDSTYIKLPNKKDILIDGGPDNKVLTELGKVMDLGDRKIDLVILTHPHTDHLDGLIEVIKRYEVGEIWETKVQYPSKTYESWQKIVREKGIKDKEGIKGVEQNFDGIKFSVLFPISSLENKTIDNLNNASIVNRLEYNQFSALFLGDAEKSSQTEIMDQAKFTTVVKTAHHGSKNGINEDFLKIIRPVIAVISVGRDNSYGHPHKEALAFFNSLASQIFRTDQDSTVQVASDGQTWQAKTQLGY